MLLPLENFKTREAIVLMGITGAGKSTFGNWLLGKSLSIVRDPLSPDDVAAGADSDSSDDGGKKVVCCENPAFQIGHGMTSMTFVPNVYEVPFDAADPTDQVNLVIDFPGFADTNGFEIRIGMDLAFRSMAEWMKPLHVVALLPIASIEAGRGNLLRQQLSKISRLLPQFDAALTANDVATEADACIWKVGITKCDKDFEVGHKHKYNQAVEAILNIDPGLRGNIIHVNVEMFGTKKKSPTKPAVMKRAIVEGTRTPIEPPQQEAMVAAINSCFPTREFMEEMGRNAWWRQTMRKRKTWSVDSDLFMPTLVSDCLNSLDCDALLKSLATFETLDLAFQHDDMAISDCHFDKNTSWEDAVSTIEESNRAMLTLVNNIRGDSRNLVEGNVLAVERRLPLIHELCVHRQPRMKRCFLDIDDKLMTMQMATLQLACTKVGETLKNLYDSGCIRSTDFEMLKETMVEVDDSMKKDLKDLGWTDKTAFLKNAGGVLGVCSALGGVGMLAHVSVTSTSLGAFFAGTGTWAALSAGATAGLATGGILLIIAIGGGLVHAGTKLATGEGDEASSKIRAAMSSGLEGLKQAHSAAAAHKRASTALRNKLSALEVMAKD